MLKENVLIKKENVQICFHNINLGWNKSYIYSSGSRNSYDARNLKNLNNFNLSNCFLKFWKNLRKREDRNAKIMKLFLEGLTKLCINSLQHA